MNPRDVGAFDKDAGSVPPREQDLLARRQKVLGASYRLFYSTPVHFVRGDDIWLYDTDGNAYLDAYNNVACVGHSNAHVVAAVAKQAATLNTHTRYLTDEIVEYAERLLASFPNSLDQVTLTCTGSEANDLAYRMAKGFTGADGFIVTDNAYHGVTSAVSGLSPSLGTGLPHHVRAIPAPNSYRNAGIDIGAKFADDLQAAIEDLGRQGIRPAALICDTIFSSDGILSGPPGMLKAAVDTIHSAGGLFIADEVQAGFGRLGHGMWGFNRHDVTPDIVTLGKPMGNGFPLAGLVTRSDIAVDFGSRTRYFNTFGGNPVACAAGMAVLDVIESQQLIPQAAEVGGEIVAQLRELADMHLSIGDIRGAGLFIGVELVRERSARTPAPELARSVVDALRERRILISSSGADGSILKIRPPLTFKSEHADRLITALDEVLTVLAGTTTTGM